MRTNEAYTRELKDSLGYTATWLPNKKLSLGDVGVLSDYQFTYRTNLKNLDIPFKDGAPGPAASFTWLSSDGVTMNIKAAGKAQIPASALSELEAGIVFSFSREFAIVFAATECTVRSISDQESLKSAILSARKSGKWDKNYVVVTELVAAGSTTVIISEGSHGRYELKAKAGLAPTLEAMNIEGNFSVIHRSQVGLNFLAEAGMTPLFRCLGLRDRFLRPEVVTERGDVIQAGSDSAYPGVTVDSVDEMDYDDYGARKMP